LIVIEVETSPSGMPREERLHVLERVDRDALAADLALRARVVRVVAHQRRHVERGREPGLPVVEQVAEALVRLHGGAEAGELPHRPELAAVHRRVDAARERERRPGSRGRGRSRPTRVGRDERLVLESGDRREELALPLGRAVVQLLAPRLCRVERVAILGRRHADDCICARGVTLPRFRCLDLDFTVSVAAIVSAACPGRVIFGPFCCLQAVVLPHGAPLRRADAVSARKTPLYRRAEEKRVNHAVAPVMSIT
jgi:hypothetical protein